MIDVLKVCDSCKTKFRYSNSEIKKFFDVEEYYGNMHTTEEQWVYCPFCGAKNTLVFKQYNQKSH